MIVFSQLSRDYTLGSQTVRALQDVSGEVFAGEMVALCGPSGSGKSTLLNVLGMLDSQYQGQVTFAGHNLTRVDKCRLRKCAARSWVLYSKNSTWCQ